MTATASKETVAPARKSNKAGLHVVADDTAGRVLLGNTATAPTIPAISPLSEYLLDEQRKHRNAVEERDMLARSLDRLDEDYSEREAIIGAKYERELLDNRRKHATARVALEANLAEQEGIIKGTEASIAALPPLESASAVMESGE